MKFFRGIIQRARADFDSFRAGAVGGLILGVMLVYPYASGVIGEFTAITTATGISIVFGLFFHDKVLTDEGKIELIPTTYNGFVYALGMEIASVSILLASFLMKLIV